MASYTTDAARWRALMIRDANANGHFIYSVKTTNIYCRPTCPGRLARRANVGFYKTVSEAEAAGFRACKRCKPNTEQEDPQERAVEKACTLIEEAAKANDPKVLRLQDLAKSVGLTPRYFHKIFKDKKGLTPKEYANAMSTEQGSPDAAPGLTGSETGAPTPDWDTFDFNSLVDFGADPDGVFMNGFLTQAGSDSTIGLNTQNDVNMLLQPWSPGYEPNGVDPDLFFIDSNLIDLEATSVPDMFQAGKDMSTVSTFELDAAALLGSESMADMLSA